MIELLYIFSLTRRALLMCSILIGNCLILRGQTVGSTAHQPNSPGPAQAAGENGAHIERELRILTERLELTDGQKPQVKSLLAEQQQQIEDFRRSIQNDPGTAGSADAKVQAIRNATEAKIAALLSEGQKLAFAIWQEQRNAMQRRHQQEDMPPPLPDPIGGPADMI
jgi:hypothetical protein